MSEEILKAYVEAGEKGIPWDHKGLQYSGRIDFDYEGGPLMVYPCSFVKIRFKGSRIKVALSNISAGEHKYIGWLLDGEESKAELKKDGISVFTIAQNLSEGEHELCLFKRMDACHMVVFHGFITDEDSFIREPEKKPERRIEVYGDSVSAGEVSEAIAYCGQPDPENHGEFSNSYYSYAWMTARKLGAELHDIAQGGIALLDNTGYFYRPDTKGMWWMYDKIQYKPSLTEIKQWDFSKYIPQVVILAIGQNDAHPQNYMRDDYMGKKANHWRTQYAAFICGLRKIYPKAHIICKTTILRHDFNWDRAIEQVVTELQDEHVHYFKYSNNSVGTKGHVRRPEAEKMAQELSTYIEELNSVYGFFPV